MQAECIRHLFDKSGCVAAKERRLQKSMYPIRCGLKLPTEASDARRLAKELNPQWSFPQKKAAVQLQNQSFHQSARAPQSWFRRRKLVKHAN
jgi:hypothetical protein